MNNKSYLLFAGTLLVGVVAWYFWLMPEHSNVNTTIADQSQSAGYKTNMSPQNETPVNRKPTVARSESDLVPSKSEIMQMVMSNDKTEKMYKLGRASNTKVYFYGKVIDQHGNPVSGALVKAWIGKWRILDSNASYYEFTTDAQGNFSIENIGAINLIIKSIEKTGYQIKADLYLHGSKKDANDPTPLWGDTSKGKPWIIHAWKESSEEYLIYKEGKYGLKYDGRKYTVNFQSGKKIEGINSNGDLIVSIWRDPNSSRGNVGNWRASLEAIGGGVIETEDTFMNEAPENGYKRVWDIAFAKDEEGYRRQTNWKKFYLESQHGKTYGRLEIKFWPYFNDKESMVHIKYWANPNSSRNLQYDPTKRIPLKQ